MNMQHMTVEQVESIMEDLEKDAVAGVRTSQQPGDAATKASEALSLKEFVNPEQLRRDVEFNVNDLDNAVSRQAALFVHYSNLARLARRQYERMKASFEIFESRLDHLWRTQLKQENPKTSEPAIAAAVKSDPRWWKAQQRMIDAQAIYELARDSREALSQRKDMIIQVSVDRRKEREGELRIMAAREGERAVQDARERALAAAAAAKRTANEIVEGNVKIAS